MKNRYLPSSAFALLIPIGLMFFVYNFSLLPSVTGVFDTQWNSGIGNRTACEKVLATVDILSQGWNRYFPAIEAIYKKYDRKILLTEMGYKSSADGAIEPWKWVEHRSPDDKLFSSETQANCYKAFFNTVWTKERFAGVHIWQRRSDYNA